MSTNRFFDFAFYRESSVSHRWARRSIRFSMEYHYGLILAGIVLAVQLVRVTFILDERDSHREVM